MINDKEYEMYIYKISFVVKMVNSNVKSHILELACTSL